MTADTSIFEHVPCGLCGADDPEPLLWVEDLRFGTLPFPIQLVCCRHCGFRYLTPQPRPGCEMAFYPDDYEPHRRMNLTARARRLLLRHEVHQLWPFLAPPRRILEVGCATGELLQCIREAGNPRVVGVEPDPKAAATARTRGLAVLTGTLDEVAFPSASFDTVLLQHVLEHLARPRQALERIGQLLRPGGTLIVWVPNGASWAAALFGPAWMGYDPPRHRSVFTPATLQRLLSETGFTVIDEEHEWHGLEWSWGVRLLARQAGATALERFLARAHFPLIVLATPVAALAALARRSGRIRVVARKRT
ncbi:class I SAM-dependent methyltransferase [Thermomicrobium sp. 4228-Ro]|uniref:class I SAM-dependent methyltransferase n=1 Tax=Thermomicrobium sp. 4228-Ro TaxID=2993937 RepID=UPI002248EAFF|nr:class I SAM-dependent methyltransferase [Thermomicrobium sp. 4228-Ro]MCX2727438.1 class I SAM-dependent methyltransferase [Thermomicrobium sp. 4228-Ro]